MPRSSHILLSSILVAAASPLLFAQEDAQKSTAGAADPLREQCLVAQGSAELARMQAERDRLYLENQLREEKLRKELADSNAELQRLKTQADLSRAKGEEELADRNLEIQK